MRPAAAVLVMLGAVWVARQAPDPFVVRVQAMKRFDPLVGEWRGSGWSVGRDGQRREFNLVEKVERKQAGTVLMIEGRGVLKTAADVVTHDGLVLLYFDERTGHYRWNGHEVQTGTSDADVTVSDHGLSWSLPAQGGATLRFTITYDSAAWREVGETSADGKTWSTFMEMRLTRTAGAR